MDISENLTKMEIFWKILSKVEIVPKILPNLRFLNIQPKLRYFENLDQNRDFPTNWQKLGFSKNDLTKTEILKSFDQIMDSFKIFKEIVKIFRKCC